MRYLSVDDILSAEDGVFIDVQVPEWGGIVRVAVMTAKARDEYDSYLYSMKDKPVSLDNLRAYYLSLCVVDEQGKRLFTRQHLEALGAKNTNVIQRIWREAEKLNATGVDAMEDLAKNS